jgi:non-heme chloroperoxidase
VHGLWLLPSSWESWRKLFEDNGYITLASGWPDDPRTREQAYANPEVFAGKSVQDVTDHYLAVISELTTKPAVIGHSFGGLIVQKIADERATAATVAIDNAPIKGVLPLPLSALKSGSPVLRNPANRHKAIALTFERSSAGGPTTSTRPRPASSTTPTTYPRPENPSLKPVSPTSCSVGTPA